MAERRMLHRKVSVSADLAALVKAHGAEAALFYTWLIPHLDRWGCAPSDPGTLRATVVPLLDVTDRDVSAWVRWLVRRGLLEPIEGPKGDKGLRVPRFHDHQNGSRFDRESPSRYEPDEITKSWTRKGAKVPISRGVPDVSRTSPDKVRLREGNKSPSPLPPMPSVPTTDAPSGSSAARPAGARRVREDPQSAAEVLAQLRASTG